MVDSVDLRTERVVRRRRRRRDAIVGGLGGDKGGFYMDFGNR